MAESSCLNATYTSIEARPVFGRARPLSDRSGNEENRARRRGDLTFVKERRIRIVGPNYYIFVVVLVMIQVDGTHIS